MGETDDVDPAVPPARDPSPWPSMKIAQARAHLATLRSRIDVWQSTRPVTADVSLLDSRLGATWHLNIRSEPPVAEWSLHVGDCIHQLRSALDACVWDLINATGHPLPADPHRIQFPIEGADPDRWAKVAKDRLRGMPAEIVERIKNLQPFNRPEGERTADGLLLLQELSNADKHRANVRVAVVMAQTAHQVAFRFADEDAAGRNVPPNATVGQPSFEHGALLARVDTIDPLDKVSGLWNFELHIVMDSSTGERPALSTLELLIGYVQNVLGFIYGVPALLTEEESQGSDEEWIDFEPRFEPPAN